MLVSRVGVRSVSQVGRRFTVGRSLTTARAVKERGDRWRRRGGDDLAEYFATCNPGLEQVMGVREGTRRPVLW